MKKISIKKTPFLLFILIMLVAALPSRLMKVVIVCESQYGACPGNVKENLEKSSGKSLAAARGESKKILKKDPLIEDFSMQYKLPNILKINILAKKPVFALRDSVSGRILLVERSGGVLLETSSSSLPTVFADNLTENVGDTTSPEKLLSMHLVEGVNSMYGKNSGMLLPDGLVVELPDQVKVIFPLNGDRDILLGTLRTVYSKLASGEQSGKFSEIDLRFKNPVLR
jgi:cell division septal protein FtsQ